jgi:hypothetical protein
VVRSAQNREVRGGRLIPFLKILRKKSYLPQEGFSAKMVLGDPPLLSDSDDFCIKRSYFRDYDNLIFQKVLRRPPLLFDSGDFLGICFS